MQLIKSLMVVLILALFLACPILAAAPAKPQTTCPVLGGNISKDIYADYKGQRVYFCCQGCDDEFKKDPEKYLQKMKEQGVQPEKAPAAK